MMALLAFPLIGRPTAASNPNLPFEDKVQCYWAKFPASVSLCALHEDPQCASNRVEDLAKSYTFVGPAPRYMTAELLGGCGSRQLQVQSLKFLRRLRDAVAEKFKAHHWLYSLQVNPCDFCHFASALVGKAGDHSFEKHFRGDLQTPSQCIRWTLLSREDEIVKFRLSRLRETMYARDWHNLKLTDRVFLARNVCWDLLTPPQTDVQSDRIAYRAIRRTLRTLKDCRFIWVRSRDGYQLVLVK